MGWLANLFLKYPEMGVAGILIGNFFHVPVSASATAICPIRASFVSFGRDNPRIASLAVPIGVIPSIC